MNHPEVWLRGPVAGVPPMLMPAAHALVQAAEDAERWAGDLAAEELWLRPGGAASIGFHLRHVAGVIDRLFTYARGEGLGSEQLAYLEAEAGAGEPAEEAAALVRRVRVAVEGAVAELREMKVESLLDPRAVGRKRLPSNVLGLVFHAAEHAQRHIGQVVATAKIIQGEDRARAPGDAS